MIKLYNIINNKQSHIHPLYPSYGSLREWALTRDKCSEQDLDMFINNLYKNTYNTIINTTNFVRHRKFKIIYRCL